MVAEAHIHSLTCYYTAASIHFSDRAQKSGGGGGEVRKRHQKNRRALRAKSKFLTLRAERSAKMKIFFFWGKRYVCPPPIFSLGAAQSQNVNAPPPPPPQDRRLCYYRIEYNKVQHGGKTTMHSLWINKINKYPSIMKMDTNSCLLLYLELLMRVEECKAYNYDR